MSRITYDRSLVEWIGMTQRGMSTLDDMVNVIATGMPPSSLPAPNIGAHAYLEKWVREQAKKQFEHRLRPALEVVLNAIDARPEDLTDKYAIKINLTPKICTVSDNGSGMSLRDLFMYLITPRSTEKEGIGEFGRYGVGFLGTFGYLLQTPKKSSIRLTTRSLSDQAYGVTFVATSERVEDIRMKIQPLGETDARGTSFDLRFPYKGDELADYLESHLKNIPPYLATIECTTDLFRTLNPFRRKLRAKARSTQVFNSRLGRWYNEMMTFERNGRRVVQPVAIKIEDTQPGEGFIDLSAQGVSVIKQAIKPNMQFTVVYPAVTRLVEGRNEFKNDEQFARSTETAVRLMEQYAHEHDDSPAAVRKIATLLPELSSVLNLGSVNFAQLPGYHFIRDTVLKNVEYVLTPDEAQKWDLLAGRSMQSLYIAVEEQAYQAWRSHLEPHELMRERFIAGGTFHKPIDFGNLVFKPGAVAPNLHAFAALAKYSGYSGIRLLRMPEAGKQPIAIINKEILVNVNHPHVKAHETRFARYAVMQSYLLEHFTAKNDKGHTHYDSNWPAEQRMLNEHFPVDCRPQEQDGARR